MAAVGKSIRLVVYTRTKTGLPNIKIIPMAIKIQEGNSLCFDLICDELNAYLKELNEDIKDYEEITYLFEGDRQLTTFYPQKMKGDK